MLPRISHVFIESREISYLALDSELKAARSLGARSLLRARHSWYEEGGLGS
jgi:hypothetical protein